VLNVVVVEVLVLNVVVVLVDVLNVVVVFLDSAVVFVVLLLVVFDVAVFQKSILFQSHLI
jgi:hypothetical protein